MVEQLPEAIITSDKTIRCPICGKKCGELTGNETIKNFKMFCRGRDKYLKNHFFIVNVDYDGKEG